MKNPTQISVLTDLFYWSLCLIIFLAIAGCGSISIQNKDEALAFPPKTSKSSNPTNTPTLAPKPKPKLTPKEQKNTATVSKKEQKTTEKDVSLDEASSAATEALLLTPVIALGSSSYKQGTPKQSKKRPNGIIDFCKVKPYTKYKTQVKNGIKAAWDAKLANKYGVGFRNKAEYNKWNNTQKDFFLYMSEACSSFAECEINSKKNKKRNSCNIQQATFDAWQDSAKRFAKEVVKFKTQQPAALCGVQPDNGDVSLCFKRRAKQIDDACDGDVCKELSQCWTSIAMKDDVIRQAESSCLFSGQKLSTCRGYIEATKHRKEHFASCNKMQNDLDLALQP